MVSNSVKHFTACDEHAPMQRLVSELLGRTTNARRNNDQAEFQIRRALVCHGCRALTHQAILNYAQAQARRKVPARTEGKWWYEFETHDHPRAFNGWTGETWEQRWQRRYDAYMKATRDWQVTA